MNKAIFLDKDGTLIHDVPNNTDPRKIRFYNDAFDALDLWIKEGFKIIIISNQSGVAYGLFEEEELKKVEKEIKLNLYLHGIPLHGFYYCPHHPLGRISGYTIQCACRKPSPGMILKAAEDLNINLTESWMVGDILNDVEAGNRAGCKSVLINNGGETEWIPGTERIPSLIVPNLIEAAEKIINYNKIKPELEERNIFLWNMYQN